MMVNLPHKRIFLHIAAYRDPELPGTILNALEKANYPERISAGVVWQGYEQDQCLIHNITNHPQIRWRYVEPSVTRGACWARAQASQLQGTEEFTLQLDSHHRFADGWDTMLENMWLQCLELQDHRKALISAYLPGYVPPNELSSAPPQSLSAVRFDYDGLVHLLGRTPLDHHGYPQPGQFLSGHFLFGPSEFWKEVPYDPELYFFGEEISLSVRAYTHGWDIYYPHRVVCYHKYNRHGRSTHWDDDPVWWQKDRASKDKIRRMLLGESVSYGLGDVRTLQQYEEYAGVKFKEMHLEERALKGLPKMT